MIKKKRVLIIVCCLILAILLTMAVLIIKKSWSLYFINNSVFDKRIPNFVLLNKNSKKMEAVDFDVLKECIGYPRPILSGQDLSTSGMVGLNFLWEYYNKIPIEYIRKLSKDEICVIQKVKDGEDEFYSYLVFEYGENAAKILGNHFYGQFYLLDSIRSYDEYKGLKAGQSATELEKIDGFHDFSFGMIDRNYYRLLKEGLEIIKLQKIPITEEEKTIYEDEQKIDTEEWKKIKEKNRYDLIENYTIDSIEFYEYGSEDFPEGCSFKSADMIELP